MGWSKHFMYRQTLTFSLPIPSKIASLSSTWYWLSHTLNKLTKTSAKLLLLLSLLSFIPVAHADVQTSTRYSIGDAEVRVYFESDFSVANQQKLLSWIKDATAAITTLYGEFPVPKIHVRLYASPDAGEPVPWGEVLKEGTFRVNFYVDPAYPLQTFINDWTATHEFSHLFHPYTGNGDAWFGEGMASYYQNILRARHGSLSEQQAWEKLIDGFRRGENTAKRSKLSLLKASRNMRATRSFVQVYWGGAAYFLNVDIKLRELTDGDQSLGSVLLKFKRCCQHQNRNWTARQLVQKLDQLSDTTVFSEEYQSLQRKPFPVYSSSLQKLGISLKGRSIELDVGNMQAVRMRRTITQG